ncbi:hypothetical protein [Parabacteroides pacaensis]|uniref:hypothetical protein n=1 Tax=Parabacteroides pacaensis TaxID=2086575 RepID=UPI00131B0A2C|nr:hypothetical protein [Parabacteroides pacaensis]
MRFESELFCAACLFPGAYLPMLVIPDFDLGAPIVKADLCQWEIADRVRHDRVG